MSPSTKTPPVRFPTATEIPAAHRLPSDLVQTEYLVDGELRRWDGPFGEAFSPVMLQADTGLLPHLLGRFPLLDAETAGTALDAARRAYGQGRGRWPTLSVAERIAHVTDFLGRFRACREEVVRLLMWEVGKSLADSQKEFDRTADYIADTVEALKDLDRDSSRPVIREGVIGQIRRGPLGVVLCMGPFNYPLNETFTTLIPALIMGNTVVFKPPRLGILLYRPLLAAFRDAFPPGVINTVYGEGKTVVGPLMATGHVDVLAFIGSSRAADALKKAHPAPHRLRGVLGMGAKNPAIVLADADLDLTVRECVLGSLSFNGQRCTALKIIFVQRPLLPAFIEAFGRAVEALCAGMPWEEGVFVTPLPEAGKPAYLAELVADAEGLGAKVVNPGGGRICGSFFAPAVVSPVDARMRLYHEEQFGPVVPVVPFDDIEEPIRYVVESSFGQQLSLFGSNPETLAPLIDPLVNQVCRLNLNSQCQRGPDSFPFTGRKGSAEGTLSVSDALRAFSIRTLVAAKEGELNRLLIRRITREGRSKFLSTDFLL
jgi:glyceraldehyde-3-phosphate dehydrogenase (NADP+)